PGQRRGECAGRLRGRSNPSRARGPSGPSVIATGSSGASASQMPIASTGAMSCAAAAVRLRTSLRSSESVTARAIAAQASPRAGGLPLASLRPAPQLAPLLQHAQPHRGAPHEEPVAARDQALDVLRVRVRVAARDVVVLADLEDAVD